MKFPRLRLHTQILIGFVVGIVFGIIANAAGISKFVETWLRPFGEAFIDLIKMIVVPLVFASLLVGTAGLGDIKKLGRIGTKTIIYFLCTTIIAITIGLLLANIVGPGRGFSEEIREKLVQENAEEVTLKLQLSDERPSVKEILFNIIPANPVKAMAEGNMLQIIFFAILLGITLTLLPSDKSRPVIEFFRVINDAMIKMVHLIMHLAPAAVFILIVSTISNFGLSILASLLKYSLVVIFALIIHTLVVYPAALKIFTKMSVRKFFSSIRDAQLFAFSSSSSSATLPLTMECAEENLGVSNEVSSFVLPLGATINMDGTALYQGVAAVFLAQIYLPEPLSIGQQVTIVLTATLASIGTAGVPAVGMIMLIMVLQSIGMDPAMITGGLAIILGVDRLLDMCRTTVNITGDATCAVVVAATEGETLKNSED